MPAAVSRDGELLRRSLTIAGLVAAAPLFALYAYSLTAARRLRPDGSTPEPALIIEQAALKLRQSGRAGWPLVQAAQQLVASHMQYSRRNSWDSPRRAFARGMGYCHQRALALHEILRQLGISADPVFATSCRFPPAVMHGYAEPARIAGHVWLRVKIAGCERDVCPGDPANVPGTVHFTPLSRVQPYRGVARLAGQLGSIYVNTRADNAAVRRQTRRRASMP